MFCYMLLTEITKTIRAVCNMWVTLALIFFGLCIWQGYVDYTRTLGVGEAYRMTSVEDVWSDISPSTYDTYFPMLRNSETPILWDPVGAALMAAPMAPVLLVIAVFFYAIRKKSY